MSIQDNQRALIAGLGSRLRGFGFGLRPIAQTFTKSTEQGRHAIHLSFIEHDADFDVTVDVAVRFDAVEEIVHRFNSLLPRAEKRKTYTLGAELGNIERGEPTRRTVAAEGDIPTVVDEIEAALKRVGLPYLNTYGDLDNAYDALAGDDRRSWLHSPIHHERAKRATAILLVAGRDAEIEGLVAAKKNFLVSTGDPGLPIYERFVAATLR